MDLLDLLKLIFRRWYISAPIIALTLGAAIALGNSIQPEYKSSAAVLLVPATVTAAPSPGASPQPGNPWLRVGENAMAQAVQISVSAHDARARVAAAGGDPNYEIGLVNRSSILTVEVTSDTRSGALTTVIAVTELIRDEVVSQQARYRSGPGEQISTEILDPGRNITQSRSNVFRAQLVVCAIGLLLAAAAAVIYDAVARRRATAQLADRPDPGPVSTSRDTSQGPVSTSRDTSQAAVTPTAPRMRTSPADPDRTLVADPRQPDPRQPDPRPAEQTGVLTAARRPTDGPGD